MLWHSCKGLTNPSASCQALDLTLSCVGKALYSGGFEGCSLIWLYQAKPAKLTAYPKPCKQHWRHQAGHSARRVHTRQGQACCKHSCPPINTCSMQCSRLASVRTCKGVTTSCRNRIPTHTIPAFFAVPSTFSVRLDASWITQYASALTAKPMAAAAHHGHSPSWRLRHHACLSAQAVHACSSAGHHHAAPLLPGLPAAAKPAAR